MINNDDRLPMLYPKVYLYGLNIFVVVTFCFNFIVLFKKNLSVKEICRTFAFLNDKRFSFFNVGQIHEHRQKIIMMFRVNLLVTFLHILILSV
jgi:hypothetical protein